MLQRGGIVLAPVHPVSSRRIDPRPLTHRPFDNLRLLKTGRPVAGPSQCPETGRHMHARGREGGIGGVFWRGTEWWVAALAAILARNRFYCPRRHTGISWAIKFNNFLSSANTDRSLKIIILCREILQHGIFKDRPIRKTRCCYSRTIYLVHRLLELSGRKVRWWYFTPKIALELQ